MNHSQSEEIVVTMQLLSELLHIKAIFCLFCFI